ncbi:hypothetical protein ASD15_21710 [Massilia sp. Root351]|jgi:hypothetical protein|uniref:hypothetical protein n=1 Tax=Massilia sp. Root351 TaxID=1736522 RepID=UPI000710CACA|nr:hypothetical protein [Massilia sp. Root351]KQV78438.1 hypothetical protein ASD15_21710 [Massilia sp. Root351]
MRLTLLLAIAAASAALGCSALACGQGANAGAGSPDGQGAPELLQRLRALESASTCSVAADCRAVPVGARLCGGPSAWLAMSAAHMAAAAPLAERYTALRKTANEAAAQEGRVSTCQVIPEPAVGCTGGVCRTLSNAPSGRAD